MCVSRERPRIHGHRQPHVDAAAEVAIREAPPVVGREQPLQHADVSAVRQHADDRSCPVVQRHWAADRLRIAPEHLRPQALTDQNHVVAASPLLVVCEEAPPDRLYAEQRQELRRDVQRREPAWFTAHRRQIELVRDDPGDGVQAPGLLAHVEHVRQRRRLPQGAAVAIGFPHRHEPPRVGVRQWPQQDGIHDAEDRRRGADTECDGQQGGCRKPPIPQQQPRRIADVPGQIAPHVGALRVGQAFRPARVSICRAEALRDIGLALQG